MRTTIHANLGELEDSDTIQGYKVKDLIIFSEAVKKAGITNDDLANFVRNAENAYDFIRQEQERMLNEAFANTMMRWKI